MLHYLQDRAGDLLLKRIISGRAKRYRAGAPRLAAVPSEHVGVAIASNGLYERAEIDLLLRVIASEALNGTIMLDIGANIGNHVCALAGGFAEAWAFEPNPPVAALLKANILMNGLENVRVCEVGLGAEDAELPFGVAEAGNDGTGSFAKGGDSKTLPVRQGDRFIAAIAAETAADARIGFIKCDVEGFEASVFEGLRETLRRHRPVVMFESGSAELGGAAWGQLQVAGYTRLERIASAGDDTANRWLREVKRMTTGNACHLVPVDAPPERECNLIAYAA